MNLLRWALWRRRNLVTLGVSVFGVMILLSVGMSLVTGPAAMREAAERDAAGGDTSALPGFGEEYPMPGFEAAGEASPTAETAPTEDAPAHDHAEGAHAHDLAPAARRPLTKRVRAFARAWLDTGNARWVKGLEPHIAPGLVPELAFYDQSGIPARGRVRAVELEDATDYGARAQVALSDDYALALILSWTGTRWEVVDFDAGEPA